MSLGTFDSQLAFPNRNDFRSLPNQPAESNWIGTYTVNVSYENVRSPSTGHSRGTYPVIANHSKTPAKTQLADFAAKKYGCENTQKKRPTPPSAQNPPISPPTPHAGIQSVEQRRVQPAKLGWVHIALLNKAQLEKVIGPFPKGGWRAQSSELDRPSAQLYTTPNDPVIKPQRAHIVGKFS